MDYDAAWKRLFGLLCRMAARKFGAEAGDALVRHLAGISDPDCLAVIGERIIDCGTGAELLEWLDANRDGAGMYRRLRVL